MKPREILSFAVPAVWLLIFVAFCVFARLKLGYWPTPDHPDPKTLGVLWLRNGLLFGLFAVGVSLVVGVLAHVVNAAKVRTASSMRKCCLSILAAIVFVVMIRFDPFLIVSWFVD